jgi:signal transduction histidine kinase
MKYLKIKHWLFKNNGHGIRKNINRKVQATALLSSLVLLLLNLIRIYDFIADPNNTGMPLNATVTLFVFFFVVYLLARTGKTNLSAWLLIISYSLPTIFCFYTWGADLPAALLMSVLIIMMAGIFLGAKKAFSVSLIFGLSILVFSYLQEKNIIAVASDWRLEPHEFADAIAYVLIASIIFLLAWLTSRENHRALKESEEDKETLKYERDNLEKTVAIRTKEIINIKREKMEQLQVLASIGQLSGGIFHDIINPLTVVNLSLEQMKSNACPSLPEAQNYIQQALSASDRIKDLVESANSCLRQQSPEISFSVHEEIIKIVQIMNAKALSNQIRLTINLIEDSQIYGSKSRFGQIIMNLISNAIDASLDSQAEKVVRIKIEKMRPEQNAKIDIIDQGTGISPENINKIFNPFFSTKIKNEKNIGLGLSVVKEIVEQDFQGQINVTSKLGEGSCFSLILPNKNEKS